jgi:hypothetical protein
VQLQSKTRSITIAFLKTDGHNQSGAFFQRLPFLLLLLLTSMPKKLKKAARAAFFMVNPRSLFPIIKFRL